jgi:hypothetical protein
MAFSMKSAMRNTVVVAAMAMLAIVESQGLVSAAGDSTASAPSPLSSYASTLLPSIAAPAIFSVLSYVALRHM